MMYEMYRARPPSEVQDLVMDTYLVAAGEVNEQNNEQVRHDVYCFIFTFTTLVLLSVLSVAWFRAFVEGFSTLCLIGICILYAVGVWGVGHWLDSRLTSIPTRVFPASLSASCRDDAFRRSDTYTGFQMKPMGSASPS